MFFDLSLVDGPTYQSTDGNNTTNESVCVE